MGFGLTIGSCSTAQFIPTHTLLLWDTWAVSLGLVWCLFCMDICFLHISAHPKWIPRHLAKRDCSHWKRGGLGFSDLIKYAHYCFYRCSCQLCRGVSFFVIIYLQVLGKSFLFFFLFLTLTSPWPQSAGSGWPFQSQKKETEWFQFLILPSRNNRAYPSLY